MFVVLVAFVFPLLEIFAYPNFLLYDILLCSSVIDTVERNRKQMISFPFYCVVVRNPCKLSL